jgi:hypothetical protein
MTCAACRDDLAHCHGTLVRHADGTVECTDDGCPGTDAGLHDLRVVCEISDHGCSCLVAMASGF